LHLRSVYIIVYLGVLGAVLFLLLRPSIDFNIHSPIELNKNQVEAIGFEKLTNLGMDTAGVRAMPRRYQRVGLYKEKTDPESGLRLTNPIEIRSSGVPLSGWSVMIGKAILSFDTQGRVRTFRGNPQFNDSYVSGVDLIEASSSVIELFGYDPQRYVLNDTIPIVSMQRDFYNPESNIKSDEDDRSRTLTWKAASERGTGPIELSLTYKPQIRTLTNPNDSITVGNIENGIQIVRFYASYHKLDNTEAAESDVSSIEIIFSVITVAVFVLLVIVTGIRQLFRGEVIWARALTLFSITAIGYISYRILVLQNLYYRILADSMVMIDILLYVFVSIIGAALIALSYLAWEGIARKQNQEQVPHIDSIWRGNLFQQKIGKAILAGYGYAGLALAMWAIGMYFFKLVYFQNDGQLGFMDPSSTFPWLTTLLNSWLYTWFTTFGAVALVTSLLMNFVNRSVLQVGLASMISALFVSQAYSFVDITGLWYQQWIVYILMMIPVVLAFKYYGILTAAVSIWIMFVVVRLFVYLGSMDGSVHLSGFILFASLLLPFGVGLVLYHFGRNSLHDEMFIPEYEQKLKKQMRLEREFQIAKESQYALLPKAAPDVKGVDVKGFFIPSFDVGGDFYEHVVRQNDHGHGDELFVTVVDVSGKGMKAALSAIFTSGLLLSRVRSQDCDPAKIVSDVNSLLYERVEKQMFVTCILAKYSIKDGLLEYVNAGHCQPILVRDGKAQLLSSALPRFPLGIRANVKYNDSQIHLEPGDTVFFYSDGLPEAKSTTGKLFDYANVPELCEKAVMDFRTSHEMCEYIKKHMLNFSNYELADDLTVVVLRV